MSPVRLAVMGFSVLVLGQAVFLHVTTGWLPDPVASHFAFDGRADGFMARSVYYWFMLAFGVLLPCVVVAALCVMPRVAPRLTNIPNRSYWLDPARRAATLDYLWRHASYLGCALLALTAAVQWLVIEANRASPARLDTAAFLALLAAFVLVSIVWLACFWRRFRRVPARGDPA